MKTSISGRRWLASSVAMLLGVAYLLSSGMPEPRVAAAQKDQENALAKFMRQKLAASSLVLEGLAVEDAALIQEGAKSMLEMSKAEMWQVLLDEDYREFNRDFRSSLRKLDQAATDKNFDRALLEWMEGVKGCVECHTYVRDHQPKLKD